MFGSGMRAGRKEPKVVSPSRSKEADAREYGDSSEPNTLPKVVTDIQAEINISWDFMTPTEFNPVPHALSLLDESSLGLDYSKFCVIFGKLEKAMDLIVNDYHQAFNTAIQTFSSVVENITDSQRRVVDSRKRLEDSKEWLQCKRFDLMHLWLKSIQHKEISRILDAIEELQTAPDRLDALIQGKYYLTAVRLLLSSMRSLDEGECAEIGALELVRQKLHEIRECLHETLIEELHNHLYLKSAFSLYRLDGVNDSSQTHSHERGDECYEKRRGQTQQKAVIDPFKKFSKLSSGAAAEYEITEDLETNPETDSFHYILCLVEALFLLGRLREALELVRDRLPIELYYVVERTVQETDRGYAGTMAQDGVRHTLDSQAPNLLGTSARQSDIRTLLRFLSGLFCKFESIIQAHSYIQHILQNLNKRSPDFKLEGLYTLRDVWYNAQNELKAMLYEYVSNAERKTADASAVVSLNDILKDKRRAKMRSESQSLFRVIGTETPDILAMYKGINPEMDTISGDEAAQVRQSLDSEEQPYEGDGSSMGIVDAYAANSVVTGHRLLIDPDPYNILTVFEPTSGFVRRMEEHLGVKFGNLKTFLDEFILSVFLPQMENRVLHYFNTYVNGIDAFNTEFAVEQSLYPLTKSAMALTALIHGICRALPTIPIHQTEAIRMIEMVLRSYYEKCLSRFNALTSSNQPGADGGYSSIISASWVRDDEIADVLSQHGFALRERGTIDREFSEALNQRETSIEMKLKKERSFHRSELLLEQRTLQSIASLHHSIEWFYNQTCTLLSVSTDKSNHPALIDAKGMKWSSDSLQSYFRLSSESLPDLPVEQDEKLALPLSAEKSNMFKSILSSFQRLSELCLGVLRVEVRCHSMYFLDLAMREGTYYLDDESQEPDPYIGLLNTDLSTVEEAMSAVLHPERTRFIFDGLACLISQVLCANIKHLKRTNSHGVGKLVRNVQSLQQNLTNISSVHFKNLDRAKDYFELLNLSPDGILEYVGINPGRFTFDEYKTVLEVTFNDGGEEWKRSQFDASLQKLKDWFVKH
ncbi:Sec8 exocyst complex component-specific domain-containing protein [Powellomyces hirtus]|nr:Sec8 exocyst complex component-specific domain-containing protein [Powellomyces hirtus]